MTARIIFSHGNSFPASTYQVMLDNLRQRGFQVDAIIERWRDDKALRVPVGALFRGPEGKWQVFVIEQGRARLQTVSIGQINEDWGEVRGGLGEGQRVVLNPANTLRDGQRVSPR